MKKSFMCLFCLILTACVNQQVSKVGIEKKQINEKVGKRERQIEKNILSKKALQLNSFDNEVVKIAVMNNNNSFCSKIKEKKYCKYMVQIENKKMNKLNCSWLIYLKQKCFDKLYFQKRNCEKISKDYVKKQCRFQKKYDEALKNKDISFCNTLPRIHKKECFERMSWK